MRFQRKLHKLVCAGQLDLKTAQREIATDWIEAYKKYVRKIPSTPVVRQTKTSPETSTASEVWVNTRSGKYWKPGSRFYGKTEEGDFMSELEALDRGYSPAWANRLCQETRSCVIAGRTIKAVTTEPEGVLVLFDDRSRMEIKTDGAAVSITGEQSEIRS